MRFAKSLSNKLEHLEFRDMSDLEEKYRINLAKLFSKIVQNNSGIKHIDLSNFSSDNNSTRIAGIIFDALLNSNIRKLQTLNIEGNS